jgi:hypothetical protein
VAAAFALSATLVLAMPSGTGGQLPESLDLTGEVEASNCVPCHATLGESDKPGLIFSHGNHLVVSCDSCHWGPAHQDGETVSPPMITCFACHGVAHGPQGDLATAECDACHPASFVLRPDSHVAKWAEKPHAERAKRDTNQCMMCHDAPTGCDECHVDEGLDVGPMPAAYLSVITEPLERPAIHVYPTQPTSMGQCMYCHPDIDDFLPGRVIFAHANHLRRNYQCTVCHPQFGHGVEEIRRPDMMSCYRCHGTVHARAGLIATEDCLACHPKDFELKPSDHTEAFEAGDHKKRASGDTSYCSMCHQAEFCVECHAGKKKLPDGTTHPKVVPVDHTNVAWLSTHGGLYLEQKGACGSCHDSASCKLCHQTVMPHPTDWLAHHKPEEGEGADCNVCHTDRSSCQNCHHDKVRSAELVAGNCTPCHDEMRQEPATEIKNKGFAEHAVHFGVEESKGKPYKCYDCHISFGTGSAAQELERLQGHDLRLCYECHGALDIHSTLIAPYKGAALCRRCHADVGI